MTLEERLWRAHRKMTPGTLGGRSLVAQRQLLTAKRVEPQATSGWLAYADGSQVMGVDIDPDYFGLVAFPNVISTVPFVSLVAGLFPAVDIGSYTVSWHIEFTRTVGTQDADGLLQVIGTGAPVVADFLDLGSGGTWNGSKSFTATEDATNVVLYLYNDAGETDPYDSSWSIGAGSWMRIE